MRIKNKIEKLPWHPERRWKIRRLEQLNKIIVHQALCDASIDAINHYHIGPNHLTEKGCPHLCYHYGIEKNGQIIQANRLEEITWHTLGANITGIGILVAGNFSAPGHKLKTGEPTQKQMKALPELCDYLLRSFGLTPLELYGHYHFGKRACPGTTIENWIDNYRDEKFRSKAITPGIRELQEKLKNRGYAPGPVDGIFGIRTAAALRKFQKENHIIPDGIPGNETWSLLNDNTQKTGKDAYTEIQIR